MTFLISKQLVRNYYNFHILALAMESEELSIKIQH
jgi:hypothetical protein